MNARYNTTALVGAFELTFSKHALKRMQKRGITHELVEFLINFGKRTRTHNEVRIAFSGNTDYIPKWLQEKLRRHPYVIVNLEKKLIKTVGWCHKRLKNKPGRKKSHGKGKRR